jgi:predicted transcriptional regulator YdeE
MPRIRIAALLVLGFGLFGRVTPSGASIESVNQPSFYVAGYSVRTNNAKEASGQGEIGKLWQRFTEQNLGAAIPNRVGSALFAVYSDYAGDEKGDYTYTLGGRVSSVDHLPMGLTYRQIAAGPYVVFDTSTGPVALVVQSEWKRIWDTPPEQMGGKRAFLTDFEVYDDRAANPQRSQVDIHIGLAVQSH